jgi:hypothetical protein
MQIEVAYRVLDCIVAAIRSSVPIARWSRKKYCMSVFPLSPEENDVAGGFRISQDGREIQFPNSQQLIRIDQLILQR